MGYHIFAFRIFAHLYHADIVIACDAQKCCLGIGETACQSVYEKLVPHPEFIAQCILKSNLKHLQKGKQVSILSKK